jgi:CMP-N,N'-diacetyllegionaminic acid synthase
MTNVLAIILARAGSKGVPGKNGALVAGRPCIEWTIDQAQAAHSVAHIALSTDSADLAAIARQREIDVLDRPADLASDTATVDSAARHAVRQFEARHPGLGGLGHQGPIVILYGNVPVRPPGLIDRAVRIMLSTDCDSVQSYAPVGKNHPWWTAVVHPDSGAVKPWEGEVLNHGIYRRQDLPPAHIPDGGVLVVSRRALFLEIPEVPSGPHAFFGASRRGVVNPEGAVIDIDSAIDLVVADAILSRAAQS